MINSSCRNGTILAMVGKYIPLASTQKNERGVSLFRRTPPLPDGPIWTNSSVGDIENQSPWLGETTLDQSHWFGWRSTPWCKTQYTGDKFYLSPPCFAFAISHVYQKGNGVHSTRPPPECLLFLLDRGTGSKGSGYTLPPSPPTPPLPHPTVEQVTKGGDTFHHPLLLTPPIPPSLGEKLRLDYHEPDNI